MTLQVNRYPWFALQTRYRSENLVATQLRGKGYEPFLPVCKSRRRWSDRVKELELPLFPGYVFCRFNGLNRLPVLTTPGVRQIVGNGNTPIPLSENEIISLQTVIKSDLPIQPFPFLQIGQKVRIEEGVLAGVVGNVIRCKQSLRLVLSITLLQRSVLLEIDQHQISVEPEIQPAFGGARHHSQSPLWLSSHCAE